MITKIIGNNTFFICFFGYFKNNSDIAPRKIYNFLTMKKFSLTIMVILVASFLATGCMGDKSNNSPAVMSQEDSIYYPSDTFHISKDSMRVCESEDGKIRFYSMDENRIAGSVAANPWYEVCCEFMTSNGKFRILDMHKGEINLTSITEVHNIDKDDGSTYYIARCWAHFSWMGGAMCLEAYKIDGDTIKRVDIIDGEELDIDVINDPYPYEFVNNFEVNYDINYPYHIMDYAFFDWMFEYDKEHRDLYIPAMILKNDSTSTITDRYYLYHFDGMKFVEKYVVPNRRLHNSLANYVFLENMFETEHHMVRIDDIDGNGSLRYASWKLPATISDTPDLIISDGWYDAEQGKYIFKNGSYTYTLDYIDLEPFEKRDDEQYLTVSKDGKIILEEKFCPYSD